MHIIASNDIVTTLVCAWFYSEILSRACSWHVFIESFTSMTLFFLAIQSKIEFFIFLQRCQKDTSTIERSAFLATLIHIAFTKRSLSDSMHYGLRNLNSRERIIRRDCIPSDDNVKFIRGRNWNGKKQPTCRPQLLSFIPYFFQSFN